MKKTILIIGGGISGLTFLYHLRKKYASANDVDVLLLEKNSDVGGNIRSIKSEDILFETGPSSFINTPGGTLDLARQLKLDAQLVAASPLSKNRYICVNNKLCPISKNFLSLLTFAPLTVLDKIRIFQEIFIPGAPNPNETVYEFGARRLGENFSRFFLDPMVSGIFGGNAKTLSLKAAFPRMYELEEQYGSLFKAMLKLKKKEPQIIWSFKNGMMELISTLKSECRDSISLNSPVEEIIKDGAQYRVLVNQKHLIADELVLAAPAFTSAELLKNVDRNLSDCLNKINYSSITVVGLVYSKEQLKNIPSGFGYLRPTHENKEILGAVFNSQVFPHRCPANKVLFQVMLGGACHPETVKKTDEEIFNLAQLEIANVLGAKGAPEKKFLQRWPRAIPQYDRGYLELCQEIQAALTPYPHLHLLANYWGGVSLNDCASNARKLAEKL